MSLYKDWTDLIEGQTDKTFDEFWEKYSSTEQRIYQGILKDKQAEVSGVFKEMAEKYEADPVIFMGFLDGIQTSLKNLSTSKKLRKTVKSNSILFGTGFSII